MKRLLIMSLFSTFTLFSSAQNILNLSDKKSVHVVCPDKVLYVRCGDDSSIEAEILPELSNIVRVKALHPFEGQTSLTVVCAGRIYSVAAQFGNCDVLTYQLESLPSEKAFPISGKLMPDESLQGISDQILSGKGNSYRTSPYQEKWITNGSQWYMYQRGCPVPGNSGHQLHEYGLRCRGV